MQTSWKKSLLVSSIALGTAFAGANALAAGDTVHWQTVIGIVQANNVVGTGTGAVTGGGTPWSAQSGQAEVNLATGELHFVVHGLALAAVERESL